MMRYIALLTRVPKIWTAERVPLRKQHSSTWHDDAGSLSEKRVNVETRDHGSFVPWSEAYVQCTCTAVAQYNGITTFVESIP